MFKFFNKPTIILAVVLFLGIHVARDLWIDRKLEAAQTEVTRLVKVEKELRAALGESERLRSAENAQAKSDLEAARKTADTRVAEARRSAGAIKRIVERPVELDPQTNCPVPDLVSSGELREALQPYPFGPAAAAPAVVLPDAPERTEAPGGGGDRSALDTGGAGGDGPVPPVDAVGTRLG